MAIAAAALAGVAAGRSSRAAPPDYPTRAQAQAQADDVSGFMATVGESQEALRRCSCSIEAIAAEVPYDDDVEAATLPSRRAGPAAARRPMCRSSPWAQETVDKMPAARTEAEQRCF